jgi:hypothetical protein
MIIKQIVKAKERIPLHKIRPGQMFSLGHSVYMADDSEESYVNMKTGVVKWLMTFPLEGNTLVTRVYGAVICTKR